MAQIDYFLNEKNPRNFSYSKSTLKQQQTLSAAHLLKETDLDKKRDNIKHLIEFMSAEDFTLLKDFDDGEWEMLLACQSITELKASLRFDTLIYSLYFAFKMYDNFS